jgi:hypothetical protein
LATPAIEGVSPEVVLAEAKYILYPRLQEGLISPYGSILMPTLSVQGLGEQLGQTLPLQTLRQAADGRNTFVTYSGSNTPALLRLTEPADDELARLSISRATKGVVFKRRETGLVTIVWKDAVFTIRHREWLVRTPIRTQVQAIRQACGQYLRPGVMGGSFAVREPISSSFPFRWAIRSKSAGFSPLVPPP